MASQAEKKITVIGIYGLPGAGKSHLLQDLEKILGSGRFKFFEGSEIIGRLKRGGLQAFKKLPENQKVELRERAIAGIKADCINDGKTGVVAGHYMVWSEAENRATSVCTQTDLTTYTHIIYLDTPAEVIAARCRDDATKVRPSLSIEQLQHWQDQEKAELRENCYHHSILFSAIKSDAVKATEMAMILEYFSQYNEKQNLIHAMQKLDKIIETQGEQVTTVLALDGDKTLAPDDTGALFWERMYRRHQLEPKSDLLGQIFSSPLGYSHKAFFQASLLIDEWTDSQTFEEVCYEVAAQVTLYPEMVSLLQKVGTEKHTNAVIITCGIGLIWQKILELAGIADKVKVIGGGRLSDGIVVDAVVKGILVRHMRHHYKLFVTVFGDSPLDLPMLRSADRAVVVVGSQETRSRSMDVELMDCINTQKLRPWQVLLGSNASPRLNSKILPVARLTDLWFVDLIIPESRLGLEFVHLTDTNTAMVLMTPMRDATKSGPTLRDAHFNTGWYLAINSLLDIIGTEEYTIAHVQGKQSSGYRLARENDTLIVALMRGGEPMALGVNKAFPNASFLHAKGPEDIKAEHLSGKATVILVDSVINSGKTMIEFVHHVHCIGPTVRILMVAGVIQAQAVKKLENFQKTIQHQKISLVALRKSDNSYTGKGGTDTGNRLFNTTYLQ